MGDVNTNFQTLYALDLAKDSEQFFRNNYPKVAFDRTDVRNVTLERVNEHLFQKDLQGLERGQLDVLTAGSPCIKIASCNTVDARDFCDENFLMTQYLPLITKDLMPKIAWFEISDRLLSKARRALLLEFTASLDFALYDYERQQLVMPAHRYGGFQTRSRTMTVLVRKDILNGRKISFFPPRENVDLSKQGANALMPWVESYWPGQFKRKYLPSVGRIFCTLTAQGTPWVKEYGCSETRKVNIEEMKIVSAMTDKDFTSISNTGIHRLLGNMVMKQVSQRMYQKFEEILSM